MVSKYVFRENFWQMTDLAICPKLSDQERLQRAMVLLRCVMIEVLGLLLILHQCLHCLRFHHSIPWGWILKPSFPIPCLLWLFPVKENIFSNTLLNDSLHLDSLTSLWKTEYLSLSSFENDPELTLLSAEIFRTGSSSNRNELDKLFQSFSGWFLDLMSSPNPNDWLKSNGSLEIILSLDSDSLLSL